MASPCSSMRAFSTRSTGTRFEAKVTLLPRDARARGDVLVAQTQERQPFLSLRRADTFPLPPSISDLLIIETQRTPTSFLTAVVSQTHVSMDYGDKCPSGHNKALDATRPRNRRKTQHGLCGEFWYPERTGFRFPRLSWFAGGRRECRPRFFLEFTLGRRDVALLLARRSVTALLDARPSSRLILVAVCGTQPPRSCGATTVVPTGRG